MCNSSAYRLERDCDFAIAVVNLFLFRAFSIQVESCLPNIQRKYRKEEMGEVQQKRSFWQNLKN